VEPAWLVTMHMWPMPTPGPLPGGSIAHFVPPEIFGDRGPPPLGGTLQPRPRSRHAPRPTTRESTSTTRTRSSSPDEYTASLDENLRRSRLDEKKIALVAEVAKKAAPKKKKGKSITDSSLVRDSSTHRTERTVVEERRDWSPASSDEVIVIEEHSPPRKSRKSHRSSGFRTVDPTAYGGTVDGKRGRRSHANPIRRPRSEGSSSRAYSPASLRSLHWEEELDPEQMEANRAIDEFLGTLVDDDYVSERRASPSCGSLPDD
jgi:hypothetical protein